MAAAFARVHGAEKIEAYSAGSRPSGRVNPKAIEAMKELGYDLTTHTSKGFAALIANFLGLRSVAFLLVNRKT